MSRWDAASVRRNSMEFNGLGRLCRQQIVHIGFLLEESLMTEKWDDRNMTRLLNLFVISSFCH